MITLAGTPLGNADDASARLGSLLATADVIAAEDTRRVRRLAKDLGIELQATVLSYFDANERVRATELVERASRCWDSRQLCTWSVRCHDSACSVWVAERPVLL